MLTFHSACLPLLIFLCYNLAIHCDCWPAANSGGNALRREKRQAEVLLARLIRGGMFGRLNGKSQMKKRRLQRLRYGGAFAYQRGASRRRPGVYYSTVGRRNYHPFHPPSPYAYRYWQNETARRNGGGSSSSSSEESGEAAMAQRQGGYRTQYPSGQGRYIAQNAAMPYRHNVPPQLRKGGYGTQYRFRQGTRGGSRRRPVAYYSTKGRRNYYPPPSSYDYVPYGEFKRKQQRDWMARRNGGRSSSSSEESGKAAKAVTHQQQGVQQQGGHGTQSPSGQGTYIGQNAAMPHNVPPQQQPQGAFQSAYNTAGQYASLAASHAQQYAPHMINAGLAAMGFGPFGAAAAGYAMNAATNFFQQSQQAAPNPVPAPAANSNAANPPPNSNPPPPPTATGPPPTGGTTP